MKIDCLMGTYGRYSLVCEALACFLQQSAISQATLLIYNQHPSPLFFDHPRVRVVNETGPQVSLRYIRQRMHELSDPAADLIHWWDDDDLYLPWHLQDCLDHVGDHVAWKPAASWVSLANTRYERKRNRFEASWIFRSDYLKAAPIDGHPDYTDHPVIRQAEEAGLLAETELGDKTSYIYRWDIGTQHLSGYATGDDRQQVENVSRWRNRSRDVKLHGELEAADLSTRWTQYLAGVRDQVAPENWQTLQSRLQPLLSA